MRLFQTLKWSAATLVANFSAQLLIAYIVLRVANDIGPRSFAIVAVALAVGPLSADVLDMGSSAHLIRQCATDRIRIGNAAWLIRVRLMGLVTPALLLFVLTLVIGKKEYSIFPLSVAYGAAITTSLALQGLLRVANIIHLAVGIPLSERLFAALIFLLLNRTNTSPAIVLLISMLAGSLFGALVSLLIIIRRAPLQSQSAPLRVWGRIYLASRHLGMGGLASDLNYAETPLVVGIAGPLAGGQFAVGMRMYGPLASPAAAISQLLYPVLASVYPDRRAAARILKQYIWVVAAYGLVLFTVATLAPLLVREVVGDEYGPATVAVIRIVCFSALLSVISQFLLMYLQAMHEDVIVGRTMIFSVVGGLCVTSLGAMHGATTAAMGNLSAALLITCLFAYFFRVTLMRGDETTSNSVEPVHDEQAKTL